MGNSQPILLPRYSACPEPSLRPEQNPLALQSWSFCLPRMSGTEPRSQMEVWPVISARWRIELVELLVCVLGSPRGCGQRWGLRSTLPIVSAPRQSICPCLGGLSDNVARKRQEREAHTFDANRRCVVTRLHQSSQKDRNKGNIAFRKSR